MIATTNSGVNLPDRCVCTLALMPPRLMQLLVQGQQPDQQGAQLQRSTGSQAMALLPAPSSVPSSSASSTDDLQGVLEDLLYQLHQPRHARIPGLQAVQTDAARSMQASQFGQSDAADTAQQLALEAGRPWRQVSEAASQAGQDGLPQAGGTPARQCNGRAAFTGNATGQSQVCHQL